MTAPAIQSELSPDGGGEALVILHRAMHSVTHWRTAMATIEMAHEGGAFVRRRRLF